MQQYLMCRKRKHYIIDAERPNRTHTDTEHQMNNVAMDRTLIGSLIKQYIHELILERCKRSI